MSLFKILVHPEAERDLHQLGKGRRERILNIIRERLGSDPSQYGKPLGGRLTGLRRIRIGDCRVAYQVEGQKVLLWAIKHRRDIYEELEKRFPTR